MKNVKLSKPAKLEIKFTEIETRNKHKEIEQKIKLCLKSDPSWKNTDLEFRKMYYIGSLGFEVMIRGKTFVTLRQLRALEIAGLFINCIGNFNDDLMLSIYEKSAKETMIKGIDEN